MKNIKITAALLSCALLLTSCGGGKNDESKPAALKIDTEKVAMTVGGENVTAGVYNFYLNNIMKQGATKEEAKEAAAEQCSDNFLIIAVAKAMGIEFSEDKLKEIADYKQQVVDSYQGEYDNFLSENGLTDADIDSIISVSYYGEELKNKAGEKEYTDEEKREYFKNNYRRAKHILISTDGKDEAEAKAKELLEKAQSGEDFDTLIADNSEDPGSKSNPDGYVFTDNEMVPEFQNGVDSIGVGEFTLVKSSFGYHVIQRLALDETPEYFEKVYSENAERIGTLMENSSFEEQVHAWAEEYNIVTYTDDKVIDEIVKNAEEPASN